MADICDFCSEAPSTRRYDAGGDILVQTFVESGPAIGPAQNYVSVWAACEKCSAYIDKGDIAGLKELVFATWEIHPDFREMMADPNGRRLAREMLDTVYGELSRKQLTLIHVQGGPQA